MGCKHSSIVPRGTDQEQMSKKNKRFLSLITISRKKKTQEEEKMQKDQPRRHTSAKISVSTVGGISFDVWIEDSQSRGSCPAHLSRKVEMDEATKDIAGAKIDEKLERAKDRRDQKIKAMREKFEMKRKVTEARIKKLQEEKEQRLNRLKDAILQK